MPAFESGIFRPGSVGVVSRSGSLGTLICLNLVQAGFGESAFIGIGGDPIIGTTTRDAVRSLDADERTEAVVIVGEIGGTMEEEAAEYMQDMRKPAVAFIAGGASPPGKKMGHAGAIVMGGQGHLRIEAQGARSGRGRGAGHPVGRRARARCGARGSGSVLMEAATGHPPSRSNMGLDTTGGPPHHPRRLRRKEHRT